jgi:alkylhydroperoxidase family enzyme
MARVPELRTLDEYANRYGDLGRADAEAFYDGWEAYVSGRGYTERVAASWAQMLHSPTLARKVFRLSYYMTHDLAWAQQLGLRELAIQPLNERFACEFSHIAHYVGGRARGGLSDAQLASIRFPENSIYNTEQRLVLEFTNAVLDRHVPPELFERAHERYGDRGMVEFAMTIFYWAYWAIVINLLQPAVSDAIDLLRLLDSSPVPVDTANPAPDNSSRVCVTPIHSIASPDDYFAVYPSADVDERAYVRDVFTRHPSLGQDRVVGLLAHNPALADLFLSFTDHLITEVAWVQRRVAWLALLTCERRVGPGDSFVAHARLAAQGQSIAGHPQPSLSGPQVSSLAFPRSPLFDDEERSVIELTEAVVAGHGHVSDELFEMARGRYGDQGMVELAVAVAYWLATPYLAAALGADAPLDEK